MTGAVRRFEFLTALDVVDVAGAAALGLHLWAAALYYGALAYSYTWLYPKVRTFLRTAERFEEFSVFVGALPSRWAPPLLAVIGATGVALAVEPWSRPASNVWRALMLGKLAVFLGVATLQCYSSWVLWPRRLRMSPADAPAMQQTMMRVAWAIGSLMILEWVLTAAAHFW
jgi:hypothetical protein